MIETLLSASGCESIETINYATNASVEADTKTTKHAFNLLEHEIKNPLAAIQTNQELLLDQLEFLVQQEKQGNVLQADEYKGKQAISQMLGISVHITQYSLQSLTHIGEVFTNVRQLTGLFHKQDIGTANTKPAYKAVRLKKLVLQALEQCLNQYPSIQTKIDCTLRDRISIMGNESLLKQAFLNIIQNGYEALAEFQPTNACLTIRLHEVLKPFKAVTIEVHNNGPVIPPEIKAQMFEPYVSTKIKKVSDGNQGLGLAVTKQAIEAHQGKLVCKSNQLEGTTFFVLLKL